jgi:hypothetical protein
MAQAKAVSTLVCIPFLLHHIRAYSFKSIKSPSDRGHELVEKILWRRMVCTKRFEPFSWLSAFIAVPCWEFQQTVWVHLSLEARSCSKPCRRMVWRLELFSSTFCLLPCWELQLDRLPAGDDSQCWCRRNWLNYAVLFQNAILTLSPVSRNRGKAKASSRPGRRHTVLRELLFALHYLARV